MSDMLHIIDSHAHLDYPQLAEDLPGATDIFLPDRPVEGVSSAPSRRGSHARWLGDVQAETTPPISSMYPIHVPWYLPGKRLSSCLLVQL